MDINKIYRAIAKKYGMSVSEVKRGMQDAIDEAYKNPNAAALAVSRKGSVPTIEEFINYNAKMVGKKMRE